MYCSTDVYVCGGYDGEQIFGDLWKINLKSLVWYKLNQDLPLPSYFHSAAITPVGIVPEGVSNKALYSIVF